jgi:hypothetical protein
LVGANKADIWSGGCVEGIQSAYKQLPMKTRLMMGLLSMFLSGCWVIPPHHSVDFGETSDGRTIMRDTPRTWEEIHDVMERHLLDEYRGLRPQGGYESWDTFWMNLFTVRRDGAQENPEKYVAYIVQRRRELGLPEINNEPTSQP